MSGELQTDYITGKTVYFLLRTATGTIWNGSSFAAYATVNYATYVIAGTEQGTASAFYVGNMPAVAAGAYSVVAKLQAGGSPAETDTSIGWGTLQWDGSFVPPPISSGVLYLASGCLSGQPITLLSGFSYTASGIWNASGANVVVPISTVSGTWPASGANTVVPISTVSGIFIASGMWPASGANTVTPISTISGTTVVVVASTLSGGIYLASGCLSGQLITLLSGFSYTASGIWNASGANVVVPISTVSGVNSVVPISTISGTTVVVPGSTLSGSIYLASGSLSGQQVTLVSGQSYTASGIWPASGANSAASISSGGVFLASGHFLFGSGQYFLGFESVASGTFASGMISNVIPDAIFTRDFSGVGTPAARSLLNAARKLINKWDTTVASGVLTVYKEDDTTTAYTQNLTSTSGAQPITELG